jgi:hypothetical protein
VFTREGGDWRQRTKLAPDDGDSNDFFGRSVAVSGDGTTVLVGADRDDDPNGDRAGSAYVFAREGGDWRQTAKLAPDDGDSTDFFGWSVAVPGDGTTALVGAPNDDDPNGDRAGSMYVFAREGGDWRQTAKLAPDDGDRSDFFGFSVAVLSDGTTTLVGAPGGDDPNGIGVGSAYIFNFDGNTRTATSTSTQASSTTNDGNNDAGDTVLSDSRGEATDTEAVDSSGEIPGFGPLAVLTAIGGAVAWARRS